MRWENPKTDEIRTLQREGDGGGAAWKRGFRVRDSIGGRSNAAVSNSFNYELTRKFYRYCSNKLQFRN